MRHGSQQDDHAAPGVAFLVQGPEAVSDGLGGHGEPLGSCRCPPAIGHGHDVHPAAVLGKAALAVGRGVQGDELAVPAPKDLRLGEDAVHKGNHVVMGAEVVGELLVQDARPLGRGLSVRPVGVDVGPAEAIDALLGVTHGAEVLVVPSVEQAHNLNLQLAGVLELVDHNHAEAVAVLSSYALVVAQGGKGVGEQVVLVKGPSVALELPKAGDNGRSQAAEQVLGQRRRKARQAVGAGLGIGLPEVAVGLHHLFLLAQVAEFGVEPSQRSGQLLVGCVLLVGEGIEGLGPVGRGQPGQSVGRLGGPRVLEHGDDGSHGPQYVVGRLPGRAGLRRGSQGGQASRHRGRTLD